MITYQVEKNKIRVLEAFQKLESLDIEGFLSYIKEDIIYTFGDEERGSGKAELKTVIMNLIYGFKEIHYEFNHVFQTGNSVVVEAEITCRRTDGSEAFTNGVIFLMMESGLIKLLNMYMDFAPLIL